MFILVPIGISFVAGVFCTIAVLQLRKRHAHRAERAFILVGPLTGLERHMHGNTDLVLPKSSRVLQSRFKDLGGAERPVEEIRWTSNSDHIIVTPSSTGTTATIEVGPAAIAGDAAKITLTGIVGSNILTDTLTVVIAEPRAVTAEIEVGDLILTP